MKYKSIFMGTPEYAMPSLQALHEESDILAIFTSPDKPTGRGKKIIPPKPKLFAVDNHIPCYQPKSFKNNIEIINTIKNLNPDLIIVVAYGFIFPKEVLQAAKISSINLHGSILPKYRGASPIQSALINNDSKTGITAQIMSEKLDEGNIIHILQTNIEENDDYITLSYRLSLLSASCIRDIFALYNKNQITPYPQNNSEASFCTKIKKEDALINWSESNQVIINKIKAFIHWPQCYTHYNNTKINILKAEKIHLPISKLPGTIIQFDKEGIIIQCGEGHLKILELKQENKKPMDHKSFLNGHKWDINTMLC